MLIPVQTFSDIITNSSSEVYISEKNEKLIKTLKANGIYYYDFTDETVLRKFVEEQFYELYDVIDYNPYGDYEFIDGFRKHYTEDQAWEILKPFYKQLLNKVYINIDRDYLFDLEVNKGINFTKLIK